VQKKIHFVLHVLKFPSKNSLSKDEYSKFCKVFDPNIKIEQGTTFMLSICKRKDQIFSKSIKDI